MRHSDIMFIDDLLKNLYHSMPSTSQLFDSDAEFISSVGFQASQGKTLTTRQAYAATNVLRKKAAKFSEMVHMEKDVFLAITNSGAWKNEPRVVVQKRNEARYLGDNLVALSFHPTAELRTDLTRVGGPVRQGVTIISVANNKKLEALIEVLGSHGFEIDEELEQYLALCMSSKGQRSHFVADGESVVCNVCDSETLSAFLLHVVGAQRI